MEPFSQGMQYFALVFARVAGLMFTAPVFGAQTVNYRTRMVLGMLIAAILYPAVVNHLGLLPDRPANFAIAAMGQAFIGISIGFFIQMIFSAFQLAGDIFSIQVGLSFSEVLDPQSQTSVPILGTLKNLMALLLFLTVSFEIGGTYAPAYLHTLGALSASFKMAPVMAISDRTLGGLLAHADQAFGVMLVTALKIGIPIMGILFITSVALGLLGRAAPQMNLMNMGIHINILVGMLVLLTLYPVLIPVMRDAFQVVFDQIGDTLGAWPKEGEL